MTLMDLSARALADRIRRGEATPSMRDLSDKLLEVYPELAERGSFGFVQLRDYIARHIPGGWGGRI